ncbi:phage major capsid protein [Rhizobium rhizogenes]|uniref:Phage major capsid protein n=1 Tax=Rhizobium rhizogenes NBRC 13257 TaxID=1220581 RepID=A0AA87QEJ3_RHIRH|nr:phage major capsid protein [Rhizobium rhizogenes]NTG60422.1 phage major capsid protein [Rhizobium rhizogenes]NTG66972.1 phage major capsid protein [Rhizobium rhizogenes]NTG79944.1 phage major capsid protein [Rhizobium rhizogenes]NTH95625.1 phage major capsid protein [Rhizobium rhizogenes]NTI67836.1 phage major capsid protein [Rhizobium rhizogenes]
MNLNHAIENRAAKLEAMKALGASPDQAAFNALESEIRALDIQIQNARKIADFERQADAQPDANLSRELRSYSVAKAIREAQDGTLTGIEREQHESLSKGREVRGVMIPTSVIFGERQQEQRAMTVGGSGGNTVATDLGGLIDRLRPVLAVQKLGANVISGLTSNLDLPRLVSGPSTTWVAEDGSSTASDSVFDKVSLKPKTITAEQYLSRRLLLQNGVALENVLRNDLAFVLAQGLDKAAIAGTGTNQPTGLLTAIAENATVSTILSDIAADLLADLELDDVTGTVGFLTNPALLAVARKIKDTTGRTIPQAEIFHNTPVVSTNQVAAIAGENPLIAGVWNELMIGYFSGVDILANPYTDASKGGLRLHAFLDCDTVVRHNQAFAWKAV